MCNIPRSWHYLQPVLNSTFLPEVLNQEKLPENVTSGRQYDFPDLPFASSLTKLFSSLRASPWHSRLVSRATLAWFLATPPTRRPIWKSERGPCNLATSTLVPLTCGL